MSDLSRSTYVNVYVNVYVYVYTALLVCVTVEGMCLCQIWYVRIKPG